MTDKLHCPFCSEELTIQPRKVANFEISVCRNPVCEYAGWHLPVDIFVRLIDGKKAQRQLRTVKDRCVHKIKAKDRTIDDCFQGIHERQIHIESLQKQLQKVQSKLKEYYIIVRGYDKAQHYVSYSTGAEWYWNWDLDHAEPFDTIQDAKEQIRAAKIPHARVMKVRRLTEITSITK